MPFGLGRAFTALTGQEKSKDQVVKNFHNAIFKEVDTDPAVMDEDIPYIARKAAAGGWGTTDPKEIVRLFKLEKLQEMEAQMLPAPAPAVGGRRNRKNKASRKAKASRKNKASRKAKASRKNKASRKAKASRKNKASRKAKASRKNRA